MQKLKESIAQICAIVVLGITGATAGALAVGPTAYAIDCSILPKSICDNADSNDQKNGGIILFLKWILTIMTGLVGIAAVGGVVWAGVLYTSAGEKAEQVKKAKQVIIDITIGLLAYGLMFIALNWIIPGGVLG